MRLRVLPVMFASGAFVLPLLQYCAPCAHAQPFTFAGNAQHSGISAAPGQHLNAIHWSVVLDRSISGGISHYAAPIVTASNTVIVGVRVTSGAFQIQAFDGATGRLKYTLATDYTAPAADSWKPVYQPVIARGPTGTRLYYPGAGGSVFCLDNPDAEPPGPAARECFYADVATYNANSNGYKSSIFINTPITSDTNGTIFFGYLLQGTPPAPMTNQNGFARLDAAGNGAVVTVAQASGDNFIRRDSPNCAPALSNDGATLYVVVKYASPHNDGYLVALDSTTLARESRVRMADPRTGYDAIANDDSTSAPMIGPDGDVYFGGQVSSTEGLLLHYSSDLQTAKLPGGFGWDHTPAIVATNLVPSYRGSSRYLLFSKYNNYESEIHRIAILDPNVSEIDPGSGLPQMREVMVAYGCTTDGTRSVREWCINAAAVDTATASVFAPAEDGRLYRWNLASNSLSEALPLQNGIGEPYVPTAIGPDGTVYAVFSAKLFAVGNLTNVAVTISSSNPDQRTMVVGQPVTFTAVVTNSDPTGPAPTGTVTFQDVMYKGSALATNSLGVVVLSNGLAVLTTSALIAGGNAPTNCLGNHFVSAIYSGDTNFPAGRATLVQKIHASGTALSLSASGLLSNNTVRITATVNPASPGLGVPTGFVEFWDNWIFLGQAPVNANATASVSLPNPIGTDHLIQASYSSDFTYAASKATLTAFPPYLTASISQPDEALQLTFPNAHAVPFTVLGSTDLALPLSGWTILGTAAEFAPGQFRFIDYEATNNIQRFYRVRSP